MRWRYVEAQATVLLNDGFARLALAAVGERRRRGLCCALGCTRSARSRRRSRSSTVSSTASANRCAASTRWRRSTRLSGSQRNAIVSRTRTQVCYVLDSWLRHYASDFFTDSDLFADSRSCWSSAPTFADSLAVWYRGETALSFHRKRSAYEAPTKRMLKYCGVELDPKNRTLFDYHPAEWRWWRRADFVLVRPSELMSRAWMKDAADAHARLSQHQAHHHSV
jgi:hypothetical protein